MFTTCNYDNEQFFIKMSYQYIYMWISVYKYVFLSKFIFMSYFMKSTSNPAQYLFPARRGSILSLWLPRVIRAPWHFRAKQALLRTSEPHWDLLEKPNPFKGVRTLVQRLQELYPTWSALA